MDVCLLSDQLTELLIMLTSGMWSAWTTEQQDNIQSVVQSRAATAT